LGRAPSAAQSLGNSLTAIFFIESSDRITIVAVMHHAGHPGTGGDVTANSVLHATHNSLRSLCAREHRRYAAL